MSKQFFTALMLIGTAAWAKPEKTLRVGIAFRLNEKFDTTVIAFTRGFDTAKALFEKKHGVKIELVPFSFGSTLESYLAASKAILESGVAAVIGGELSEEALVLGEQLEKAGIVLITPTASTPKVTAGKKFVFRACFSDDVVADRLASFVAKRLKPKVVGIFHNVSSPYTDFLSTRFKETFDKVKARQTRVVVEKVLRHTTDIDPLLDQFHKEGADVVTMFAHSSDLIRVASHGVKKQYFPIYIGSDGWGSNGYVLDKIVKEMPEGHKFQAYRNVYWKEDEVNALSTEFRADFERRHKEKPNAWGAMAFDTAWVLFSAMDKASAPDSGDAIRKSLEALHLKELVTTADFTFDKNHSPARDLYIYRINRDGVRYEATLK
jgi:branched-chain amino acid transport system substrate-binding protein